MTQHDHGDCKLKVTEIVGGPYFDYIQACSRQVFDGREVQDLSFDQVTHLIGAISTGLAQSAEEAVMRNGDGTVILDLVADGSEAYLGATKQNAARTAHESDEFVLVVIGRETLWDRILGRQPRVIKTIPFHKEPPEYAEV